jgi:type I restriction enzyme R subunit
MPEEKGDRMPCLSERRNIVVIADEAHRSQYDTLALNMRTALPRALFTAFTGTPLIDGEERTREVFGDYVSIYDFRQAVKMAPPCRCSTRTARPNYSWSTPISTTIFMQ